MSTVKAVAVISAGNGGVKGSLQFLQDTSNGVTHVKGRISGLSPGLHGFHIHALGDTTNGYNSTGPHFNPLKMDHGAPSNQTRHAGDLGNIVAGPDGVAEISIKDTHIPLIGPHSILGLAVVVHADPDDLGRGIVIFKTMCIDIVVMVALATSSVYVFPSLGFVPWWKNYIPFVISVLL